MYASTTPRRSVDNELPKQRRAMGFARARRATARCGPRFIRFGPNSQIVPADAPDHAPKSSSASGSCRRPGTIALPSRDQAPGRTTQKSIEPANATARVQSNQVSASAARRRNSYFVRLRSSPWISPDRISSGLFLNAHHHRSVRQQLEVVWDRLLQAGFEGPSFIFRTAAHHLLDRRCS